MQQFSIKGHTVNLNADCFARARKRLATHIETARAELRDITVSTALAFTANDPPALFACDKVYQAERRVAALERMAEALVDLEQRCRHDESPRALVS